MLFEAPVTAVVCVGANVVAELGVPDCTGVDMVAGADGVVGLGGVGTLENLRRIWSDGRIGRVSR